MEIGQSFTATTTVVKELTAEVMGSGDMPVFATPAMIALMENAAMKAVASDLPEGSSTVGIEMSVSHMKASAIGAAISAKAEITEIDGRKITFSVVAKEGDATIGEGKHVRFVVDKEKFLSKL